ncbi:Dihydroorotase [Frankliniella fusca]|uniref:Dihydroorotase n=1 Tax=Frankliniella fusca TaxID=407009 RepID=A0AAE1H4D3_9NEOP|nr:Dihydroorotase [Frankliniella fusca]
MDVSSIEHEYSSSSQRVPSPDLFSSDDDEPSQTEIASKQSPNTSSIIPEVRKKDAMQELESARLQRLMSLLQGVPPPPSVTIPQISLNEVLQKLSENYLKLAESSLEEHVHSLWKPKSSLEEVKATKWPFIKNLVYHDMHFNLCTASEEIEHISMKLNERFIGAETSTWCNSVTSQPSSAKKRQRRSLGNASPGCRLSHLARRRQTFSSASIAQLSSVAGSGTAGGAPIPGSSLSAHRRRLLNGGSAGQRCIMVEIKKSDKNKRVKTNSKDGQIKKKLPENAPKPVSQPQEPIQATKRALFQSPEEQKRVPSLLQQPCVTDNQVQRSKRALWPSDGESILNGNGKRTLDQSDSSNSQRAKMHCSDDRAPYSRLTRSLTFPLGHNSGTSKATAVGSSNPLPNNPNDTCSNSAKSSVRRASDQGPSDGSIKIELSELHKRKLFWAITSALRSHNISRNHQDFTRLSSMLAYHYIEVRSNMSGPAPASTSEHMLKVVSSKAAEVIQVENTEKSENLVSSKLQKKEERSNRELFRDATASLNVRRSLCVSLTSANQLSEDKPRATKRVPSARKSLSFDAIDPKATSGTCNEDHIEKGEVKFQLDGKGKDPNWKGNGENVPLSSAKRVSRSLFLSPKDELKSAKKDACEQTNGPGNQSSSHTTNDSAEIINHKIEESKKSSPSDVCDVDEKPPQAGSDLSSIPSFSAASSTLEADNEASITSEATNVSEQANSNDVHNHLPGAYPNIPLKDKTYTMPSVSSYSRIESANMEASECVPTRVLRETKERILRACYPQPVRRSRKSLSLSKRELRSSSSDSVELDHAPTSHHQENPSASFAMAENCTSGVSTSSSTMEPVVVLSPLKLPSPSVSAESNNTSKSTFGSPPFIIDNTLTSALSPFLGFPSKEDLNSSGGVDGTDSIAKVPDGSSEEGTNAKLVMEEKVITPLLEAGVLESSVCVGSGSSESTDADLTFRGRIESLKPSTSSDNAINLELGMNLSSNLLNLDENKEKSPVLEKWAERASRSAQKSSLELVESVNDGTCGGSVALLKPTENTAEESMLPWDESQLETVSQCSTNVFEKFCSIFDPSSHQGNA